MEVVSVICTSPPFLEEVCSDKFKSHLRTCISILWHEFLLSCLLYELWTQCHFLFMTGRWSLHFNKLLYGRLNSQNTQFTEEKKVKICYSGLSQTQMGKVSREKSQLPICTADLYFILTSEGVPCSGCVQMMQQKSAMQITDPQCRSDTRILLTGW